MDSHRFDHWIRTLADSSSRRNLLFGLAVTAIGFVEGRDSDTVAAKKRKKKPQLNAYGCLDVGQKCAGNSARCCSGICQGKKPKKGKPDKRRCVAHNALTCQDGQDSCLGTNLCCGSSGICVQTTGKASYCGRTPNCAVCQKDADCEAMKGPGAACGACVVCPGTGGTACYSAAT